MQRKPVTPENALIRLETLCARSEHCRYELETKLHSWGISADDSQKIISSLASRRFFNDTRFARCFVNDKFRFSNYGRIKIGLLLAAKRISKDIREESLATIDEDSYRARLKEILSSKAAKTPDADSYDGCTRLFRYGVSRGFESSLVADTIRELFRKKGC